MMVRELNHSALLSNSVSDSVCDLPISDLNLERDYF